MRAKGIEPKSPAEQVLRADDIITAMDGQPCADAFDCFIRIVQRKPDDDVALQILRDGKPLSVKLTLGRMPQPSPKEVLSEKLGVSARDLTRQPGRQSRSGVDAGMVLTSVVKGGPAAQASLAEGDIVLQIGAHPVRSVTDAAAALRPLMPGDRVAILVMRQNYAAYARVTIGK